jgi:hypothetical protein
MLAEHGLQLESIGGDIVGVPISALKVEEIFFSSQKQNSFSLI